MLLKSELCGLLALLFLVSACRDAKQEALALTECRKAEDCKDPNHCFGGTCVAPCERDADCAPSWLCSGRRDFGIAETRTYKFCRPATVEVGGSCKAVKDGCKKGLNCFKDQCKGPCEADKDCPGTERCLSIVIGGIVKQDELFKTCLPANEKEGQACDDYKEKMCARGLICLRGHCRKHCGGDEDCEAPKSCSAYSMPFNPSKRQYVYYCVAGTLKEGDACNADTDLPPEATCQRGLICDSKKKKCAELCESDGDCGKGRKCEGEEWEANVMVRWKNPTFRFCK